MRACNPGRHLWLALLIAGIVAPDAPARERPWFKVEGEKFTLISGASERDTLAWGRDFTQFVASLQHFIPVDMRRLTPVTIVIFPGDSQFNPYRPLGANGRPLDMAGMFSRRDTWSVAAMGRAAATEELRRILFHEGAHWFMSGFSKPNPVWVEEGVAEVFSTFVVERNQLQWGNALPGHVQLLRDNRPMPLDQLMTLHRSVLFHGGRQATGMAYAQSWAFAHFLLFGKHEIPREAVSEYLELYHSALHPDEAFRRAFGADFGAIERQFLSYLQGGTYYVGKPPLYDVGEVTVVRADSAEVEVALAQVAVAGQRLELARQHADEAVRLLPDDPRGYEMRGLVLDEQGNRAEAVANFRNAALRKSRNADVYFQLGLDLVRSASGELSAADARQATLFYQQSIVLNPYRMWSYRNVAGLAARLETIMDHDTRILEQGRRLFPEDGMIAIGAAVLKKRAGEGDAARVLLDGVIASEQPDRTVLDYARTLDQSWRMEQIQQTTQALMAESRHAEALAVLDEGIAAMGDIRTRTTLIQMRRNALGALRMAEVRTAWEARNWEEARRLLDDLIASDTPSTAKIYARQRLAELNRRNLGRPAAPAADEGKLSEAP